MHYDDDDDDPADHDEDDDDDDDDDDDGNDISHAYEDQGDPESIIVMTV